MLDKIKQNKKGIIIQICIFSLSFITLFYSMKVFNDALSFNPFNSFEFTIITFIIWICLFVFFKGFTNKNTVALLLVIGLEFIFDAINCFVRTVRGLSITISDIAAIKTGLSVVHNVDFKLPLCFILGIIIGIFSILTIIIFRKKIINIKHKWYTRITMIVVGFLVIFSFSLTNIYKNHSIWDVNYNYSTLGTPITLLRLAHNMYVKPPKGYNKNDVKSILEKYNLASSNKDSDNVSDNDCPNIIVIINESFCDYYNLYNDGYSDPIKYFNALSKEENVISGTMYSSEFGGQTSNVEYEFLTQNSMRILPVGSFVFQQYINKPVDSSIVAYLKSLGYTTSAIHPWENFAYSRNKIYKYFGFDKMKFKNDIEGLEESFNNEFITDKSTYRELIRQIDNKKDDEKIFEYVLTVQNHVSFSNPDPNQEIYNDANNKNVYMQLIHDSSEALKDVINELKNKDEKYILLFFGDHQPSLDEDTENVEKDLNHYATPFIIWANYDIEEQYDVKTSTIYLQNILLNAAGIPYSSMNNYMSNLQKNYPIITKHFYINNTGDIFQTEDDISESYLALEEYNKIDYYRIFNK